MQIGIVATKIGLSVDAIRFYERNGLLPIPQERKVASDDTARTTWKL